MSKALSDNLWISFYIDNLSLWVTQQSLGETSESALAIHEHGLVYQANQKALASGIEAGLGKASALSRCPQLLWIARDPKAETQYLNEQCWWLSRFTPHLCQEDGFLLAEVSRSLKLFGGLQTFVEQILEGFSNPRLSLNVAIACTARAAMWLSRWQSSPPSNPPSRLEHRHTHFKHILMATEPSSLATLLKDIDILCLSPHTEAGRHSQNLQMMREDLGLMTLKSLWDMPRRSLRQRLGAKALLAMDQALGLEADPRTWLKIPEPLKLHRELTFWAEDSKQLFKLGQMLIEQACAQLKARRLGLMAMSFQLHHRDMFHIVSIADHRPELAQKLFELDASKAFVDKTADHNKIVSMSGHEQTMGLPRPIWFFDQAIPITERAKRPYWQGPLALVAGPERIETAWWEGEWFARDYFIAADQDHVLYWIYRSRPSTSEQNSYQWFIQGCFG
ncbi:MAG: DNA polymerase Y family protein [Betaproteobacteria bacterium]|nr:DNA polymerase Y family protein [Betaproteobacteria bacterium]